MDFRLYVFTPTTHLFTFFLFFLLKKFAKVTKMYYLCTAKSEQGTLAERLGNGLQNRVEQFDSASTLLGTSITTVKVLTFTVYFYA